MRYFRNYPYYVILNEVKDLKSEDRVKSVCSVEILRLLRALRMTERGMGLQ